MRQIGLQSRWACLAGILAIVVTVGGWFQAAPSTSEVPAPTIRVSTHLVLVDVVVTDKQGKPVTGLHQEDFVVQEKGKNQKVAFFTAPGESQSQPPPVLPPGIYSNKPEYRSPGGPLVILLLDAANTPFKDQAYARQQMLKFVKEEYKPGQRTAVFTLTNTLGELKDFTADPNGVWKALQSYQPLAQEMANGAAPRPPSIASPGRGSSAEAAAGGVVELMKEFQNIQLAYVLDRRVATTVAAMRALARILGGIPGRKSVIWVTAAFPFSLIPENRDVSSEELAESLPSVNQLGLSTRAGGAIAGVERQGHAQEIREASAQLASAQVAIYPVDARGLMSGMEATIDDVAARQVDSMTDAAQLRMSDATASQETMREVARETGGIAYINQNEIKEGFVVAMADSASSYTLGYYPEDKKWDGKYRSVKVKLNRDGVDTRYRRGYFAIDPASLKTNPEQGAVEALQDSAPDTLVTFSAQVKPAASGKLGVDFLVDARTLSAEDVSGGNKKFNMVLYAAIFAPDGKMLGSQSLKVDQAFDVATYQQIVGKGMLLHMDLNLPPGKNELRMAVRDNRTGNTGTLTAPL